jgi:hypothetical protein
LARQSVRGDEHSAAASGRERADHDGHQQIKSQLGYIEMSVKDRQNEVAEVDDRG